MSTWEIIMLMVVCLWLGGGVGYGIAMREAIKMADELFRKMKGGTS